MSYRIRPGDLVSFVKHAPDQVKLHVDLISYRNVLDRRQPVRIDRDTSTMVIIEIVSHRNYGKLARVLSNKGIGYVNAGLLKRVL